MDRPSTIEYGLGSSNSARVMSESYRITNLAFSHNNTINGLQTLSSASELLQSEYDSFIVIRKRCTDIQQVHFIIQIQLQC